MWSSDRGSSVHFFSPARLSRALKASGDFYLVLSVLIPCVLFCSLRVLSLSHGLTLPVSHSAAMDDNRCLPTPGAQVYLPTTNTCQVCPPITSTPPLSVGDEHLLGTPTDNEHPTRNLSYLVICIQIWSSYECMRIFMRACFDLPFTGAARPLVHG
jgi:hypothetical protein